ncbi:hypothetical protein [Candidatus Nitrosocosmicus hydrocola]|uniref:hypothetical protein n=1 Tax=Candidatus Nitrosocosmicus hydrocola TaxID=1826872 RepID=UPI00137295A5|nr:hypothetical protein [Candidatus Nitrosocosmicus hydrocola]
MSRQTKGRLLPATMYRLLLFFTKSEVKILTVITNPTKERIANLYLSINTNAPLK